jgi:2,3-bisphosphoglycerate-dependent phosphoglycerate mutase
MAKDIRLFLVRHGQSEANLDVEVNKRVADHMVGLTGEGARQADAAGVFIEDFLMREAGGDVFRLPPVRVWSSPYLRTRQTTAGVVGRMSSVVAPIREADLLREQEFGLFDGIPEEDLPSLFPREHAQYRKFEAFEGRYWARMPQGESRADVSQRMNIFFDRLHRDLERDVHLHGRDLKVRDVVVVSHGVTLRCLVKEWLGLPYEWIEQERNPANCSVRLIEGGIDKGYVFQGFPVHGRSKQEAREDGLPSDVSGFPAP